MWLGKLLVSAICQSETPVREEWLLCGIGDKYNKKKPAHVLQKVESEEFEANIRFYGRKRADQWKYTVVYILSNHSDLVAEDVVCHRNCRVHLANTSLGISTIFANEMEKSVVKKGRPCNDEQIQAFNMVMDFFEKNEEENLTISDLVKKMSEFLIE